MHRSGAIRFASIALSCLLAAGPVWGWGREGHRIVALLAAKNLSPTARAKVAAIFGTDDAGVEAAMAAASTWPDEINRNATGTANWHFINVPVTGPFSVGTLCAQHDCVIDRITEMEDRLRNNRIGFMLKSEPVPARPMTSQELAFLIHFIGDIHQPLHVSNDGDQGGNCVRLAQPLTHSDGRRDTTKLHAVWDTDEVISVMKVLGDENAAAAALYQRFRDGAAIAQLTPLDWARESNDLARKDIYGKLNIPHYDETADNSCAPGIAELSIKDASVDQSYLDSNRADVEERLMQAGIRLSNVLNQICAGSGCEAHPGAEQAGEQAQEQAAPTERRRVDFP
jgi:hypothetical protein